MPQVSPIVRLDRVDVDIEGQRVLHEIELAIAPGQHFGLVGANGSGKSTLLALLAGRRWPAPGSGSRRYDFGSGPERDAVTARERVALLGHELQDTYIGRGWNFRARDIVHSGVTRTDIPQRRASAASRREAEALLEAMDLGHLAERRFLELSRGEQRRVLIARSLAFEPALLLLDEPASGLDADSRTALEPTLAHAAARTTIVVAAHSSVELPAIVTQIARLEHGRLRMDGAELVRTAAAAGFAANGVVAPGTARGRPGQRRIMIALESASVWLGGREILHEIDWELASDEHWLVTGPNGAGKSTFLRLLHAELRPARGGTISWPGIGNPRDVWSLRRQIALVSPELQARYRLPTRVFEAVASGLDASIGLTRHLTPEQSARVSALLERFELTNVSKRYLSTLSYGVRHRVLIARTLATDPAIVLLDEPWEGLDAATRAIVGAELARRMAAGTAVVCVSHLGAGGLSFNRTLALDRGRIVRADDSGAPRENSSSAQSRASGSPPH